MSKFFRFLLPLAFAAVFMSCDSDTKYIYPPVGVVNRVTDFYFFNDGKSFLYIHYNTSHTNLMQYNMELGLSRRLAVDAGGSLSPDGKWIVCTSNTIENGNENLDIYVLRTDGSRLTQLTYHKDNDLSPVWSPDGKSIYFLSQRGSEKGTYNIWKMNFNL